MSIFSILSVIWYYWYIVFDDIRHSLSLFSDILLFSSFMLLMASSYSSEAWPVMTYSTTIVCVLILSIFGLYPDYCVLQYYLINDTAYNVWYIGQLVCDGYCVWYSILTLYLSCNILQLMSNEALLSKAILFVPGIVTGLRATIQRNQ